MNFAWDERKRQSNMQKHDVDFADAVAVFFDDLALSIDDPNHYDEQRFITIGMDTQGRILVVIHTYPDEDTIRIISARPADRQERREYEN